MAADLPFVLGCDDAIAWLRGVPTASVHLAITDPPYESLEKWRAMGTTTRLSRSKSSSNDWFPIFPNDRFPELFAELWRVLARNAHLYLFCDHETARVVVPMGEAAGFKFWKPLIWSKVAIGMGYHYRSLYEMILFFEKGKRRLNDLGVADVIEGRRIYNGYPTEKPVPVARVLVDQSSAPGERVIDPFMGSGAVGVAAREAGREFWGADISERAVDLAAGRLSSVTPGAS